MDIIAVSELRANLMNVLKKIKHGSVVDITSRGEVVAKLVPPDYSRTEAKSKLKELSKTAVLGDVVSPVDTKWESAKK